MTHTLAVAVALILAFVGCAAVVGGSWFTRSWKQFAKEEAEAGPEAKSDDDGAAHPADDDAPADDGSSPAAQKARAALLTRSWPL